MWVTIHEEFNEKKDLVLKVERKTIPHGHLVRVTQMKCREYDLGELGTEELVGNPVITTTFVPSSDFTATSIVYEELDETDIPVLTLECKFIPGGWLAKITQRIPAKNIVQGVQGEEKSDNPIITTAFVPSPICAQEIVPKI